jgi:hypothetical protein
MGLGECGSAGNLELSADGLVTVEDCIGSWS